MRLLPAYIRLLMVLFEKSIPIINAPAITESQAVKLASLIVRRNTYSPRLIGSSNAYCIPYAELSSSGSFEKFMPENQNDTKIITANIAHNVTLNKVFLPSTLSILNIAHTFCGLNKVIFQTNVGCLYAIHVNTFFIQCIFYNSSTFLKAINTYIITA